MWGQVSVSFHILFVREDTVRFREVTVCSCEDTVQTGADTVYDDFCYL